MKELNIKTLEVLGISEEIRKLLYDALWTDGEHHKQYYLWEIAMKLGYKAEDFSEGLPDKGTPP